MDGSDFIIMLARQRSGTNPLRAVMETHPHVFCTPEVFHDTPSVAAELEVETNFFGFLDHHPLGTVRRSMSEEVQGRLFVDFLEFLRCFTDRRYVLVDVKYNSAHHLDGPWREISAQPDLFRFVKRNGVRVLNLTRRNTLRSHLSLIKANLTQTWTLEAAADFQPPDARVTVDVDEMLHVLRTSEREDAVVASSFEGYEPYLTFDYEDLFPDLGGAPSSIVLERFATWLGIEPDFDTRRVAYRKQSALPLRETIKNYQEVETALEGTTLAHCLEDESMYRNRLRPRRRSNASVTAR